MRARALLLAGLAALTLSGCTTTVAGEASPATDAGARAGADGPSEGELLDAAADALQRAGSVRVQGGMAMDGAPMQVDLSFRDDDVAGSMAIEGQTVQIVVTDGDMYMQAGADFWTDSGAPRAVLPMLADTWVLVPAEAGVLDADELQLSALVDELRVPAGGVEIVATEFEGQPVWELRQRSGDVLQIAAEGEPYPLRMSHSGLEGGAVRYSEFGTVAPIVAPTDYLDVRDFGG